MPNPNHKQALVRLQPICEIVRTAIWSGRLQDEKPVSIVLIAAQESAKSAALLIYEATKTVLAFSDITSKGIAAFKSQIESGEIRHILALDLIRLVSHGRFVSDRTIQTLAGLMEEGQAMQADAGGIDLWKGLPNVGVLASVTPEFYRSRRGHWRQTGFLTRFLPVNYHFSDPTVKVIHDKISGGLRTPKPQPQVLPTEATLVTLTQKQAEQIRNWAVEWGLENETYGFRHHRQIRALVKARALMARRSKVIESDLKVLESWRRFFSQNQPAII